MKLILQAIKAILRKFEASIGSAQVTADNAKSLADNAKATADKAQVTAGLKMSANNPVGSGAFSMGRKPGSAVGEHSHAEGYGTTASGSYSHAEGYSTTASGAYSHAEGFNTRASASYSHAQGKFNIEDSSGTYAHVVGNGSTSKRSNAHTLDWNGVPWFQGRPQFGGTAQDDGSQTVMANGDSEIILTSTGGKKFSITVDDSGALTAAEITT